MNKKKGLFIPFFLFFGLILLRIYRSEIIITMTVDWFIDGQFKLKILFNQIFIVKFLFLTKIKIKKI